MPKPRIIDASFWDDPDVMALSRDERLLLVGMITICADDEGRLMANPAYLRKQVFGYDDDVTIAMVQEWRDHILSTCRNVVGYAVNGQEYIFFRNWDKYQNIRYKVSSKLPPPPEAGGNGAEPTDAEQAPADFEEIPAEPHDSAEDPRDFAENSREFPQISANCGNFPEIAENSRSVGLGRVRVELGREVLPPPPSGGERAKPPPEPPNLSPEDPPPEDPPPRHKRAPSEKDLKRGALEEHFAALTGLPKPKRNTAKQRREAGELWWGPLRDILELASWDLDTARGLVDAAVAHMAQENLTISAPKSIYKTALSLWAQRRRAPGIRAGPEPEGFAAVRQVLAEVENGKP